MLGINNQYYTSRGHGCGFYSELIFVDSKALKWAHSRLRNYFSNTAIGQKQPIGNRIRDRAKYLLLREKIVLFNYLGNCLA
jgi:hypothetical protein